MRKIILILSFVGIAACESVPTQVTVNVLHDACIREDSLIVRFDSLGVVMAVDTVYIGRCVRPADVTE